MDENIFAGFPIVKEISVAWSDMDSYAHVNNAKYFTYFETSRIAYFQKLFDEHFKSSHTIGPILAATTCNFLFPVTFPDTLLVGSKISKVSEHSFTMDYLAFSQRHNKTCAKGNGVIVAFDYEKQCKAKLPESTKARIKQIENKTN